MASERGGPSTVSGMLFQISWATLYLGRLIDLKITSENEKVVEVRIEAPDYVDDIVVTYEDEHKVYIQAKESISLSSEAWERLWNDFVKQRWAPKFGEKDRLLLALGTHREDYLKLKAICNRALGSKNADDWFSNEPKRLTAPMKKIVEKVRSLLPEEYQGDEAIWELFSHVDVKIHTRAQIEGDVGRKAMPESSTNPKTLFSLLRDCSWGFASNRMPIYEGTLLDKLSTENKVDIKGHEVFERKLFEPETVLIPKGTFIMGSNDKSYRNEYPGDELSLSSFRIGKYPVMNIEFKDFLLWTKKAVPLQLGWEGQRLPKAMEKMPVQGVSFRMAKEYCIWLSDRTSRFYRLPNEAEWEKAARGKEGWIYPWGNEWKDDRCNYGKKVVAEVEAYPPQSVYACYDMVGNIPEWTCTRWGNNFERPDDEYRYPWKNDLRNDPHYAGGRRVVYRGGYYKDASEYPRCSIRNSCFPDKGVNIDIPIGFRVVLD